MPPGKHTPLYDRIATSAQGTQLRYLVPEGTDVRVVQQNIHHAMRRRGISVHTHRAGRTVHITRV